VAADSGIDKVTLFLFLATAIHLTRGAAIEQLIIIAELWGHRLLFEIDEHDEREAIWKRIARVP
jgi:hypothetical protein